MMGANTKSTAPISYPLSLSISEVLYAVTKMIGVRSNRGRWRIIAAISNPSISGITTSRRMSAQSSFNRHCNASRPDRASTRFSPNSARIA